MTRNLNGCHCDARHRWQQGKARQGGVTEEAPCVGSKKRWQPTSRQKQSAQNTLVRVVGTVSATREHQTVGTTQRFSAKSFHNSREHPSNDRTNC